MPAPGDAYGNEVWADTPNWWWRSDEATGVGGPVDYMGGPNGTYAGPPTINQPPLILTGKSVLYDGVDDGAFWADAAAHRPTLLMVELWLDPDPTIANFAPALIKANSSWTNGYGMVWVSGQLRWFINNYTTASASVSNHIDATIPSGGSHVIGMFNGSQMRMFTDGVEVAGSPVALTAAINHDATVPLRVGFDGAGDWWKGKIDEPAIYGSIFSSPSGRVITHYSTGSGAEVFVDLAAESVSDSEDTAVLSTVAAEAAIGSGHWGLTLNGDPLPVPEGLMPATSLDSTTLLDAGGVA